MDRMAIDVGDTGAQADDVAARVAAALPALAVLHVHACDVTPGSEDAVAAVMRGKQVCRSCLCSLGQRVPKTFWW